MSEAVPSSTGRAPAAQVLCPWLIEAKLGAVVIRGRARFPEDVRPPASTAGGRWDEATIPSGTIEWSGESFEARWQGVRHKHVDLVDSDLMHALYERAIRPAHDRSGEVRYRIDSIEWRAPTELEDKLYIGGTAGDLVCEDGVPVAVVFEASHPADFASLAPAFKAIFAGHATLGPWQLTPRPLKPGAPADWQHYDGRAPVAWHPPARWQPQAALTRTAELVP